MTVKTRPTEAELVVQLVRLLRRRWPVRALGHEVRSHGRCRTDACFLVRTRGAETPLLLGIEAKLSNWSRAVTQAALNRYAVDLSYVAVPLERVSQALLDEAARHGVGVLGIGRGQLEVSLPAVLSGPDPILRARVLTQLVRVRPRGQENLPHLIEPSAATPAGAGVAV